MADKSGIEAAMNDALPARFQKAKREERLYTTTATASEAGGNLVSSNGGTLNLALENPSDSGKSFEVAAFIPSANFAGWFRVYDAFDSGPSGGSSVTVDNVLMDTANTNGTSTMNARQGVTFTPDSSDDPHIETLFESGGTPSNQISGGARTDNPIVEPGRTIVAEAENTSGSTEPASVAVVFAEFNEVFSN